MPSSGTLNPQDEGELCTDFFFQVGFPPLVSAPPLWSLPMFFQNEHLPQTQGRKEILAFMGSARIFEILFLKLMKEGRQPPFSQRRLPEASISEGIWVGFGFGVNPSFSRCGPTDRCSAPVAPRRVHAARRNGQRVHGADRRLFVCRLGGTPLTYSVESAFVLEIDQSGGILDQIPCIFLPPTHLDYLPHLPHRKKSRLHARRPRSGSAVSGCEFCWHFCGAWETTIYTSVSYTWDWQSLQADHWV